MIKQTSLGKTPGNSQTSFKIIFTLKRGHKGPFICIQKKYIGGHL